MIIIWQYNKWINRESVIVKNEKGSEDSAFAVLALEMTLAFFCAEINVKHIWRNCQKERKNEEWIRSGDKDNFMEYFYNVISCKDNEYFR